MARPRKHQLWKPTKALKQITTDVGRWYQDGKRNKYYSVTTIIDAQKSAQDILVLEKWKQKEVEAGRNPAQASLDGDMMHKMIENYLQDMELPREGKDRAYKLFDQYYKGFLLPTDIQPTMIEGAVYNTVNNYRYAGTVDLVASIQTEPETPRKLAIIDHKSIKNIKQVGWKAGKHLIQIAAYAKAIKDQYNKEVDVAIVNYASTTGFKSMVYNKEEIAKAWSNFYNFYLKKFYEEGHDAKFQGAEPITKYTFVDGPVSGNNDNTVSLP
jgi:hypothetical protein